MSGTTQFDPRQEMRRDIFENFHSQDTTLDTVEPHHHDFYEVYRFLRGQVEYRVEGVPYRPQPGDLLLIRPMQLHQVAVRSADTPYERIVLWVGQRYLEGLQEDAPGLMACFSGDGPVYLPHAPGEEDGAIPFLLEALLEEQRRPGEGSDLFVRGAFSSCWCCSTGRPAKPAPPQKAPVAWSPRWWHTSTPTTARRSAWNSWPRCST